MNMNTFFTANKSHFWLDPRTKIIILIAVNIVVICGGLNGISAYIRPLLASLPFILLLAERKTKIAIIYFVLLFPAMMLEFFFIGSTNGILNIIILLYTGILSRFLPGIITGYYLISTTKISELIAAMERMHISQNIIIPFAVMIRFFPTVSEENNAINDAMRMRGVRIGGGNAIAMLEYRIVPMLMSTVKIGEELSAAALTRGLGSPTKRTNISKVGFKFIDLVLILFVISAFILWILF